MMHLLCRQISKLSITEFYFTDYGRDLFKDLKLSPDASLQVVLQVQAWASHEHAK